MFFSEYRDYLVVNRTDGEISQAVCNGEEVQANITKDIFNISCVHTYEIYVKNPRTGESGWDIHYVKSTDDLIKCYPEFDCIITKNDTAGKETIDFLDFKLY